MKTDDLVVMLSTNVEPIRHGRVGRTISIAVVVGAVIALAIMLVGLGVRADVTTSRAALFLSLKLAFAFAVVGVALRYLIMLARPGSESGISPLAVAVPFAAIALLGLLSLADAPSGHWNRMVVAGMPFIDSNHRHRPLCGDYLCGAKSCAHQPCSRRCIRRPCCWRRQRNGLRLSLHRRFIAVCRGVVRRNDCAVHLGRGIPGTSALALVIALLSRRSELVTGRWSAPNSSSEAHITRFQQ